MITPVILCGGSGTRLWPLSRTAYPKQFINLTSNASMLQETMLRLNGVEASAPVVICNEEHRFLVAEQLRQLQLRASILLEPVGRNTAPAIALAALGMQAEGRGDDVMLVLAADHVIRDVKAFQHAVGVAYAQAQAGYLVTFGIVPTEPATGYGYIRAAGESAAVMPVAGFVEKPDLDTATAYLASGAYYWNSGMFMFTADAYLTALARYRPDIMEACRLSLAKPQMDMDFTRVDVAAFEACPDDSIDYAVMEKTDRAVVVPLDAGWSDVGSWSALWDVKEKDQNDNVAEGDVLLEDSAGCFVYAGDRLVAALGLENLVIVDTPDALLVAPKSKVQDIKTVVSRIKAAGRSEHLQHREVFRPWGKYDAIDAGERYQVKRITVNPGARLSLQKHHHRAEHWVVVSGTAEVRRGDEVMLLTENQSTYIPLGAVHQLHNPGKVALEMIEVQSGSYLGEDDIVRFEDDYGRAD